MKQRIITIGKVPQKRVLTKTHACSVIQSCLTLCDLVDCSPPGSSVRGILQARTLEWVAISFSSAWTWKVKVKSLSRLWLCVTPWTAAYQAPPPMGFSRQEDWSGVPLPSPEDLPDSGTEPVSPVSPALASRCFTTEPPEKPQEHSLYPILL